MGCLQDAQHFIRHALHHGGPAAGFAAAPLARRKPAFPATTSIAAKPAKPCDRGVFGALNLLPKREREHAYPGRACLAFCACRPALSGVRHERHPQARFHGPLAGRQYFARRALHHSGPAARFAAAARLPQASVFRYYFDSNKARQTVRWGRFWGLEFAPNSRANKRLGQPCRDEPGLAQLDWVA